MRERGQENSILESFMHFPLYLYHSLLIDSKTNHNSGLHVKNQRKSLVLKLEGFFGLQEGENAGKRGKCEKGGGKYKDRGKCIKESRIEFPDPMLMTLETQLGPITKFLKKCPKKAGKIICSPFWCLVQKLDHNSGLQAKNQREISSNKVRRLLWPLGGGKCGKGGEMV